MKPAITERMKGSQKRHLGNPGGDGGGGIGERSRSACDETFAVPQPGALRKS